MAQYYGSVQGARGSVSRLGHKSSGIHGNICGWNIGAKVSICHIDGKDVVTVYKTHGSNGGGQDELLAKFSA